MLKNYWLDKAKEREDKRLWQHGSLYGPLIQTPVLLDPNNIFVPRKGLLTRYGKKILDQGKQHYGKK